MRKWARGLSLLLAGCLAAGLLPAQTLAAEELTPLPAPERVEWITEEQEVTFTRSDGKTYTDILYPGTVLHSNVPEGTGQYVYYLYDESGQDVTRGTYDTGVDHTLDLVEYPVYQLLEAVGSGTYVLGVQAVGDGETTTDSDITKSEPWTYTAPEKQLATPTNVRWAKDENGDLAMSFDPPANDGTIYLLTIQWYLVPAGGDISQRDKIARSTTRTGDSLFSGTFRHYRIDDLINKYGVGDYYFQLQLHSEDITLARASEWSELSDAYPVRDIAAEITEQVDQLTQNLTGDSAPKEIQAAIDSVKALDTADLKTAMSADRESQGVVEQLAKLEELSAVKTQVAVAGDEAVQVDPAKVSVVGAALNAQENVSSVTLNIGKPAQEAVIPGVYKNTIQLDFTLDNVEEHSGTGRLAVPVRITLPVPGNIKKDKLHILHFHNSTQDYEEIRDFYSFTQNGVDYVTFVVDRFSTFAFVEEGEAVSQPTPTPTVKPTAKPPVSSDDDDDDDDYYRPSKPKATPKPTPMPTPAPTQTPAPTPTAAPTPAPVAYGDVQAGSWYADSVSFVTGRGLFQGMAPGRFAPEQDMSRAMVLTVLGRMDGADVTCTGPEWYKNAVAWAVAEGISDGSAPTSPITRQELITLLYRYAGSPAPGGQTLTAPDSGDIAPWAADAMAWAVETGLVQGDQAGRLLPNAAATRAQVAAVFQRYVERIAPSPSQNLS